MTAIADVDQRAPLRRGWKNRLILSPRFQRWAARFPLTRRHVRREGEAMFDLVAGFAKSQVLRALIELRVLHLLLDAPLPARALAAQVSLPEDRALVLLNAGVAIGLLHQTRKGFGVTARGAALLGVPGLQAMILHHDVLYRDLADPVAFFRGEVQTELAGFWPYVFGEGTGASAEDSARYSQLMADSQGLVADEALSQIDLGGVRRLMDVGGGTGVFLSHVAARDPELKLVLFDLPQVMAPARVALTDRGLIDRIGLMPGSFKTDPLPKGADAVSLIRVLYDHDNAAVADLLRKIRAALPPGGRIIISEPMTGGTQPHVPGDVYFALYCMAMRTGTARSATRIAEMLSDAGFIDIQCPAPRRAFVTSTITARLPDTTTV